MRKDCHYCFLLLSHSNLQPYLPGMASILIISGYSLHQYHSYASCNEHNCSHIHFIAFVDFGLETLTTARSLRQLDYFIEVDAAVLDIWTVVTFRSNNVNRLREIVYPCISDPDGEDGGQASSSLAVSTRWISTAKLLESDHVTLVQMEGGE
ncbi:hypothetical protein B296_00056352 [Ensete ventricosum]|uniref:Uncharacterized protein n=1 Tax=Ensete ventricosum TaxID=4639 RepID=A0A426XVI1_ENSVE|nr:hypothetical protein B296_00056352 [Ensete ventricosum]